MPPAPVAGTSGASGASGAAGTSGAGVQLGGNPYWNADNPAMYRGKDYTHEQMVPNPDYNPNGKEGIFQRPGPEFIARGDPPMIDNPNYDPSSRGFFGNFKPGEDSPGNTRQILGPATETVPGTQKGIFGNTPDVTRPVAWPYAKSKTLSAAPRQAASPFPDKILGRT